MIDTVLYRKETVRGIGAALEGVSEESLAATLEAVRSAPRVFFTGVGRSFLMMQAMAMAFMQVGVTAYVTGGVTTPSIKAGDLLIGASCSGETRSVALFMEQAKETGAKIVLLTSSLESTMGKLADIIIHVDGNSEPGSVQESWIADCRYEQAIVPIADCLQQAIASANAASQNIISQNHANME